MTKIKKRELSFIEFFKICFPNKKIPKKRSNNNGAYQSRIELFFNIPHIWAKSKPA